MQVNYSWFIIGWTVRRTTVGRQDKGFFNITQNRIWILGVFLTDLHKIYIYTHQASKILPFRIPAFQFSEAISDMLALAFKLRSVSQTSL